MVAPIANHFCIAVTPVLQTVPHEEEQSEGFHHTCIVPMSTCNEAWAPVIVPPFPSWALISTCAVIYLKKYRIHAWVILSIALNTKKLSGTERLLYII